MTNLQILTFQNQDIRTITKDNQLYMLGTDIARALGYQNIKKVSDLYQRNKEEFLPHECIKEKLVMNCGRTVNAFYFNQTGAQLLAMKARTNLGIAFRRFCLEFVNGNIAQPSLPAPQTTTPPTHDLRDVVAAVDAYRAAQDIRKTLEHHTLQPQAEALEEWARQQMRDILLCVMPAAKELAA